MDLDYGGEVMRAHRHEDTNNRCVYERRDGSIGCDYEDSAMNLATTENGKSVIAPTVHLNGSGKESLLEQYHGIREAIWATQKAMAEAHPHGRDYYVQNRPEEGLHGDAVRRAALEHRARLLKLIEVEEEINAIIFNIQDQGR